jgi:hypothetical protein
LIKWLTYAYIRTLFLLGKKMSNSWSCGGLFTSSCTLSG